MTHRRNIQHTLECDEDGCRHVARIDNILSKKIAIQHFRERGWSSHEGGDYCPDHNTK